MKKINIAFLIMVMLLPLSVAAKKVDPDYTVEKSYISAEVDIVGSMHVREAIVVKGDLNGYERTINFQNSRLAKWQPGKVDFANSSIYNARGLNISSVSAKKISKDEIGWSLLDSEFPKFEEEDRSEVGDSQEYTVEETTDGGKVRVYNVNEGGYAVFYFDYYLDQVAVIHNDCAEIYYTFFVLDEDVGEVNIQVTTPGYSEESIFRVWAHGPMSGEIKPVSDKKDDKGEYLYKGALANLKNYPAGEGIEIRMTFDRNILASFESFIDNSEMDAFDKIVEVEDIRTEEMNKERRRQKIIYNTLFGFGIVYLVGLVIIWVLMYLKYDREHKVDFDMHYYREFTGDYLPESVEYLFKEDITPDAMNASILNLIYKKNIDFEENPKDKKNITLKEKNRKNLASSEEVLMQLLFDTIGKEGKVTLKEIEKFSSKFSTAEAFMGKYNTWRSYAIAASKKENFFESLLAPRLYATLYFMLGVLIFILMLGFNIRPVVLPIVILVASLVFLIYVWMFKKWSKKGREHYLKWKAFKNFLVDFGTLDEKEIPEIKLWDKYLVYATVLGVAKEVEKAMKVRLSSMGEIDTVSMPRSFTYGDFYMMNSISHSMNVARTKSMSVISAENAKSSMSSNGFGGGFSGGGGFAGGGGGGHGF